MGAFNAQWTQVRWLINGELRLRSSALAGSSTAGGSCGPLAAAQGASSGRVPANRHGHAIGVGANSSFVVEPDRRGLLCRQSRRPLSGSSFVNYVGLFDV